MKQLFLAMIVVSGFSVQVTAFAKTTYLCDMRDVLTGLYTVGSGTKVAVDEKNNTASVFMRPTAPNTDWSVVYNLKTENEYETARYTSGKTYQDLDVIFTRLGSYMNKPGASDSDSVQMGSLVYNRYDALGGFHGNQTLVYMCVQENAK